MNNIKLGDVVFTGDGRPSVVKARDEKKGNLNLDRTHEALKTSLRHGYKNGLNEEQRSDFNSILDDVKELESPMERVEELKSILSELEKDPTKFILTRYVRSELSHIMNTHGIQARLFTVPESKIKT